MKAFPLRWDFFKTVLQGSPNPQNYELAPKIPKKITSTPQLPDNNWPFSPDPQNPWGPNSADPDQTPHKVASDQGLHCLLTEYSIEIWIKL